LRLLRAKRNDYPRWYAEYDIEDLTITFDGFKEAMIDKLTKDIADKGLLHPIVIRSPYKEYQTDPNPDVSDLTAEERQKVFNIYIGNQRVTAAKRLGYTRISAYHVKRDEDARMIVNQTQMREFV
jgi:hypothetical protein